MMLSTFPLFPNKEHSGPKGTNDDGEDEFTENDSDDENGPGIWEYFQRQLEKDKQNEYNISPAFHTLYIRSDFKRVLMEVELSKLEDLFFVTLSNDGYEGTLPDHWDETPKNVGLQFAMAPNERNVFLMEAQARLGQNDFASSMYSPVTGGMQRGYNHIFDPIVRDEGRNSVLLDITSWL
jgi:hypothetical protein